MDGRNVFIDYKITKKQKRKTQNKNQNRKKQNQIQQNKKHGCIIS